MIHFFTSIMIFLGSNQPSLGQSANYPNFERDPEHFRIYLDPSAWCEFPEKDPVTGAINGTHRFVVYPTKSPGPRFGIFDLALFFNYDPIARKRYKELVPKFRWSVDPYTDYEVLFETDLFDLVINVSKGERFIDCDNCWFTYLDEISTIVFHEFDENGKKVDRKIENGVCELSPSNGG